MVSYRTCVTKKVFGCVLTHHPGACSAGFHLVGNIVLLCLRGRGCRVRLVNAISAIGPVGAICMPVLVLVFAAALVIRSYRLPDNAQVLLRALDASVLECNSEVCLGSYPRYLRHEDCCPALEHITTETVLP